MQCLSGLFKINDKCYFCEIGCKGAINAMMLLDLFLSRRATLLFDLCIPVPRVIQVSPPALTTREHLFDMRIHLTWS